MKNLVRSLSVFVEKAVVVLFLLMIKACAPSVSDENAVENPAAEAPAILSINELLFNPLGDGVDYVEVVNVSSDTLDMSRFRLANRNSKGEVANIKSLAYRLLPPNAYLLLCSDTAWVKAHYVLPDSANVLIVKTMPSFANAGGYVVLLDERSAIVDEFPYEESYHHPLVGDVEGLALEKLHPSLPSAAPDSWTTAALDVGGGTPAYVNSQYRPSMLVSTHAQGFYLENAVFYPQALSSDAQCLLHYRFDETYVANVTVYDLYAFPCARLANNLLLGKSGCLVWTGCDDDGNALFPATYLIHVEAYSWSGNTYAETFVVRIGPP